MSTDTLGGQGDETAKLDTAVEPASAETPTPKAPPEYLTVAQIVDAEDLTEEDVLTPEWGGKVRVRALTKRRQQALRKVASPGGKFDPELFEVGLVIEGVIQPDLDASQIETLRDKAAGPMDRIAQAVMKVSGLNAEAADEAEAEFRDEPAA